MVVYEVVFLLSLFFVYGETASETKKFHLDRQYRIGGDKV